MDVLALSTSDMTLLGKKRLLWVELVKVQGGGGGVNIMGFVFYEKEKFGDNTWGEQQQVTQRQSPG